ncbi:MAG: serine hydrolase [Acidobacteria bacterium]|nr:serine hydrolase [Acidobacteriota bacterium]
MTTTRPLIALIALVLLTPASIDGQQEERYDYWKPQRQMIAYGQQAVFMCNGLFAGNRTREYVFAQELAFLPHPVGTPAGGDYVVDEARKTVAVGSAGGTPIMRAAFREGIGCVILAPDQTFEDLDSLPSLDLPYPPGDPATIPWPDGDLVMSNALPAGVDAAALQAASDWAFNRESPEQVTLSLLVVHKGQIIHERYAPGMDMTTRTRTWSATKSIAGTLVGMLVDQGKLQLDEPLGFDWLPQALSPETDPRNAITLRNLLNMSSGLDTIDNEGLEYATGSGLSYWAGSSSVQGALRQALIRQPGTSWDYENYDTLLAVLKMKQVLGNERTYREFPRRALLDKIGMRNTLIGTDRFGDFILSSQVYSNARDLARFGMLYLQNGMWNGERLISQDWIDFERTPAPATVGRGGQYGAQWWLVPEDRNDVPKDMYAASGNRGNYSIVVPSHDLVIVRRGLDYGSQGFDRWSLAREVIKAIDAPGNSGQ